MIKVWKGIVIQFHEQIHQAINYFKIIIIIFMTDFIQWVDTYHKVPKFPTSNKDEYNNNGFYFEKKASAMRTITPRMNHQQEWALHHLLNIFYKSPTGVAATAILDKLSTRLIFDNNDFQKRNDKQWIKKVILIGKLIYSWI